MLPIKDFFNLVLEFGDEWVVTNVDIDHKLEEIYIDLSYQSDYYEDPETAQSAKLYDHAPQRIWRHLDVLHYKTFIRSRIPRVTCKSGQVKQIAFGWADKHDRHTYDFENKVIDLLNATKNQTKTADFLNCSFRLVNRILHTSVKRGMKRRDISTIPIENICIDEKSFKSGHNYVTVISHPRSATVLDVGERRDTQSARDLIEQTFTQKQRENINTVSMDMWKPYIKAVESTLPNAEIVHDKFHLIKYLNEAIDKVRRREVKSNDMLRNSRYVLLKNPENLTDNQQKVYEMIKYQNFEVSQVMQLRENFKSLFNVYNEENSAFELLKIWIDDACRKGIQEVNKIVLMFMNHARGVVNSLISGLTNAMAERLNGKIQEIKVSGRGYRKFENFRSAILFFHGGLDLYPLKW
jgi:transposase